MALTIDLNCDMGESFGNYRIGNDAAVFPFITSVNIACGFHGGDPLHIRNTILGALEHNVIIGAHPSYPDLQGFGRRKMHIPQNELSALLLYQISALKGMTESEGGRLRYVKPHGALYNSAATNKEEAHLICKAIQQIDPNLYLLGLAGSAMETAARETSTHFAAEAFADRRYTPDGLLASRQLPGAVLHDPQQAANQIIDIITKRQVKSTDGSFISLQANSICIHGDNPQAIPLLKVIDTQLKAHQITKAPFCQ